MIYPLTKWRFLMTPPSAGDWNMAVDEAILEAVGRGDVLPTLRLYAWVPPCLSLGYAQRFADVDRNRLAERGWGLVRRPTGGRAILHTDELTYAVIGPYSDPRLSGSVLESYQRLSAALLKALSLLDIPAQVNEVVTNERNAKGPVCFEVPSNYEITVNGKKLIGSAQARRKEGVLQHGSLPLYGNLTRIIKVLVYSNEAKRADAESRLRVHATTAAEILGQPLTWDTAAKAFKAAFTEVLNLELSTGDLTPSERSRAAELDTEKYANPKWTERV